MNGADGEIRLERRLVLASWFAAQLGYSSPAGMLDALKDFNGEWGENHPALSGILSGDSWGGAGKLREEDLREYDRAIGSDLRRLNGARGAERVSLKYFQYLALLASEHFLERRKSPAGLAAELNEFRLLRAPAGTLWPEFRGEEDLDKLALWMATGSGKTLLMHLHYMQFMRRLPFSPDNVILLTPNEELSGQHLREMRLSGVPCFRHGEGILGSAKNAVRVLECTKLRVGRRPGKGATEGTDSFEGRNVVFADEGHRGAGGEVFMDARRELAAGGFCFEYSATFGQALYAAANGELAAEYGRAIALDYSYKHFYGDGYGKDFRVLNLAGDPPDEEVDVLMLGNLLSFCQQRLLYAEERESLAAHNPSSPLLLLLGTTVTGGKKESEWDTDLARLLLFLHRASFDPDGRLAAAAGRILRGESGLPSQSGGDAFSGRLDFLHERFGGDGAAALAKLREVVFHSSAPAPLCLRPVKNARGEIGLSAGGGNPFGLAFVGNAAKLQDLALKRGGPEGMEELEDSVGGSLFAGINRPGSPVNILIGAKKFMEGWSSWRVSGMGLLNVGKGEGSQIIQLFGRGVRLRGRENSLKRAAMEKGAHEKDADALRKLRELETLNIFGSRAAFVEKFTKYLAREGVTEDETVEVLTRNSDAGFFQRGLWVPKFPPSGDFSETVAVSATAQTAGGKVPRVTVDFSTRMRAVSGEDWDGHSAAAGEEKKFTAEVLAALDFGELRRRLLRRREESGFFNLLILGGELRGILEKRCLVIASHFGPPASFAESRRLHDIAFSALWKYAESLHRSRRKRWETRNMTYAALDGKGGNFPRHYTVRAANRGIAEAVRGLLRDCEKLYGKADVEGYSALPRVYFDRHLYQPLLAEAARFKGGKAEVLFPPALNKGERDFVESLRRHLEKNGVPAGEYFLLRNLSRGRGVGFFTDAGFYPDFILWIKGDDQRIIFIEPHGLLHDDHPDGNSKVGLHELLAKISGALAEADPKWKHVRMDSFIISQTDAEKVRERWGAKWTEEECARNHILFPKDDHSHIARILADGD